MVQGSRVLKRARRNFASAAISTSDHCEIESWHGSAKRASRWL
jgi:hypothetical protein